MDSRQLRYFLAICDEGTFSAAARRLGISQPPLSFQIKAFEQSMGVRLFDRSHRKATLTAAGSQLLPEAREIMRRIESAEMALRDAGAGRQGNVSVGVEDGVRSELLTKRLRKFARRHRGVRLIISMLDRSVIQAGGDRFDLMIAGCVAGVDTGVGRVMESVGLGLALPRKHRLAGRSSVAATDLTGETFILESADGSSSIDRVLRKALPGDGFTFDDTQIRSLEQRLWAVGVGLGLSICSREEAEGSRWRLRWVPIEPALPRWETRLIAGKASREAVVPLLIDELSSSHD